MNLGKYTERFPIARITGGPSHTSTALGDSTGERLPTSWLPLTSLPYPRSLSSAHDPNFLFEVLSEALELGKQCMDALDALDTCVETDEDDDCARPLPHDSGGTSQSVRSNDAASTSDPTDAKKPQQ